MGYRFAELQRFALAEFQRKLQRTAEEAIARDKAANVAPPSGCGRCADGWLVEPGQGARRCECWLRERATPGMPVAWRTLHLTDVERHAGNRDAVDVIARFVRRESAGPICLSGSCGTGKSILASAGLNELFWAGDMYALFLSFAEFIDTQRRGQNFGDADAVAHAKRLLESARRADPLLVDDLGAGAANSDFVQDELYKLIEWRRTRGRRTIFTTNLSIDDSRPGTPSIFGLDQRIVSRLYEGDVVNVAGRDRRLDRPASSNVVKMSRSGR